MHAHNRLSVYFDSTNWSRYFPGKHQRWVEEEIVAEANA